MTERKPNLMECNTCKKVADFKDEYKPDTLFHKCDGASSKRIGAWKKYTKKDK